MASVFDLFNTAKPAPAAPTTPTAPPAAAASANANPTVPNASNTLTTEGAGASPLDQYKDLWKNDPNAKPDTPFSFNSDPAKLLDTAKTVDFTKVVSPEIMARIHAGGSDGQNAMMEAMNSVTQLSFAQSSHAATKITESALQAQEERFKAMLPDLIKQHSVRDAFRTDNPLLNDPALAPMVHALQSQFTKQYPQATANEIKQHVNDYLDGAASRIQSSRPQPKAESKGRQEIDWEAHFLGNKQ